MTTIVTRTGKGSPLTNTEVDTNFTNLNTSKVETLTSTDTSVAITGTGSSRNLSVPAQVYPAAGIPNSTGSAWSTSYGTSGANSIALRDANQQINANSFLFQTTTTISNSATPVTLNVGSSVHQLITTGSGAQSFYLPDATTLGIGRNFYFNNNISSNSVNIYLADTTTLLKSIPIGGDIKIICTDISTSNGVWDVHSYAPSNTTWGSFTFNYPGTITAATWGGNTIGTSKGGIGLTTVGTAGQVLTSNGTTLSYTTPTTGTVTSVTGTAPVVSSGGNTPAISMAAANTSTNGYLTSTDWNTFNGKQAAGTYVNSVTATSPVTSTGGATPAISMAAATTSVSGYLTSTDWTTFNNKQPAGSYLTSAVTSAAAGTGISVSASTGAVTFTNSGVTSLVAGTGISLSGSTGAVTVTNTVTGASITDDTTTAATYYPLFSTVTTGSLSAVRVSSTKYTYNPSTGVLSATVHTSTSDERLKTNWVGLDKDFVSRLADVKSGIFDRIDFKTTDVGVGAQSLQKLLPQAVIEGADGYLSVNYGGAALVAAIELAKEVQVLRAEIAELKATKLYKLKKYALIFLNN